MTFPQASAPGGSFRGIFKLKGAGLPQAGIPTGFILLIVLAILMAILLNKARPGRYILSLGSNKEATRLSGVNVVKWETLAYVISGLFAGLAGVSYAAVYSTLMPFVGVQPHYQLLITGFVLIIAVFVDVLNRRKQGKD